jgi:hypothetical protein
VTVKWIKKHLGILGRSSVFSSDSVNPNINENVFEQKVLHTLEKLGWSHRRGELKVKHSLQIGRQGYITPDIVAYTPDNKAVLVLEIKRPAEDLNKPGCFGQLRSYMRQTKADFGLLVGKEIYVYYDGTLNPHAEPLLLSKIRFKSDSTEGTDFVRLFNRDSIVAGEYELYLKAHIARLDQEQRIDTLKGYLQSEEIRQKLFKFLQNEFRESETQILMAAMEGLTVNISYQQEYVKKKIGPLGAAVPRAPQTPVSVCRNKASGKHFIHIDDLSDNKVLLISPDGVQTALIANLFDQPKDESIDYLLSRKLITEIQLEKYTEYESQQSEDADMSSENYLDQIKAKRIQRSGRTTGRIISSSSTDGGNNQGDGTRNMKPRGCTVNGMHYENANDAVDALCRDGVIQQSNKPTSSFNAHLWLSNKRNTFGYTYIRDNF